MNSVYDIQLGLEGNINGSLWLFNIRMNNYVDTGIFFMLNGAEGQMLNVIECTIEKIMIKHCGAKPTLEKKYKQQHLINDAMILTSTRTGQVKKVFNIPVKILSSSEINELYK